MSQKGEESEMTANGQKISFVGWKSVKAEIWCFLYICDITKNELILYLKQQNFKTCKADFNKVVKKGFIKVGLQYLLNERIPVVNYGTYSIMITT